MNLIPAINKFSDYLLNEKNYSRNTLMNYVRDLNDLYKFIAGSMETENDKNFRIELEYIDEETLKSFLAGFVRSDRKYSKKTISRKISTLKSFYKYLNRKKLYEDNPSKNLIFPKLAKNLPYVLDEKSINRLLESKYFDNDFDGIRDKAIIELLYSTGIRLSELINLKPENIDFNNHLIKIKGKGNKERIVPFGTNAGSSVLKYINSKDRYFSDSKKSYDRDYVFNAKNGKKLYPALMNRITGKYIEKVAEIKKKKPPCAKTYIRYAFVE